MSTISLAALLSACGGNGTSTGFKFSGTAATGAAFVGATVTATDAAGTLGNCTKTDAITGTFSCTFAATPQTPILVQATLTDTEGNSISHYSLATDTQESTINITPLTTALVAGLTDSGDPTQFIQELKSNPAIASRDKVIAQVTLLIDALANVTPAGLILDPLHGVLTAGSGIGMDGVLDTVIVDITSKNDGVTTPYITLALRTALDTPPTTINQGATTATALAASAVVLPTGQNSPTNLIASFIERMNACYAQPTATRVANTGGAAADVSSTECKTLFTQDDPTLFKSSGKLVSANGAFSNLFSDAATGAVVDQGNLEFLSGTNNHWVVSYRATGKDATVTYGALVLAQEGSAATPVLKLIGNQNDYDTSVGAFVQDREFVNDGPYSYLSTGYNVTVPNKIVDGASIYSQVVVTAPDGTTQFTLKPLAGCSYLGLVAADNLPYCTNFIRLSYAYTNGAPAGTTDSSIPSNNPKLRFASTSWSDEKLAGLPAYGKWIFDITLKDGTLITQTNRTLSRAPTLKAVQNMTFAQFTPNFKADVVAETSSNGYALLSGTDTSLELSGDNSTGEAWTVATGAIAPTSITAWGNAPKVGASWGNSFNDSVTFSAAAREATVFCSRQSANDLHCADLVGVNGLGAYKEGTRVTELQLVARSTKGALLTKHLAFYPGHY